jgi:hypothetical protein
MAARTQMGGSCGRRLREDTLSSSCEEPVTRTASRATVSKRQLPLSCPSLCSLCVSKCPTACRSCSDPTLSCTKPPWNHRAWMAKVRSITQEPARDSWLCVISGPSWDLWSSCAHVVLGSPEGSLFRAAKTTDLTPASLQRAAVGGRAPMTWPQNSHHIPPPAIVS